jgi:hypothetical protein
VKAILINFFVLTALLSLMSCSAGKQDVSLKVSAGFALSSAGYTGGLVVTGKNTNGKKFTATAIGGTQLNVLLENGSWTINVAGWDGAANFAGDVYCGQTTAQLDTDTKIVDITVNKENCNSTEFHGGNAALYNAATATYRPMNVYNCGALYMYSGGNYLPMDATTSYGSFSAGFCAGTNLPKSLSDKAKSGRIVIDGSVANNKLLGTCVNSNVAGMMFNSRIPAAGIPVKIQLFEESDCKDDPIEFKFANGISAGSLDFDSVINNNASSYYSVFLPFNDLKKGYSALMNHLPKLKCGGVDCLPDVNVPADYFGWSNGQYNQFKLPIPSCAGYSFTPGANINFESGRSCYEQNGEAYTSILISGGACVSFPYCNFSFTNGAATTLTVSANFEHNQDREMYNKIWDIFGSNSTRPFYDYTNFNNQNDNHDKYDQHSGIADDVIEQMGPGGPISLFGNVTCEGLQGIKHVALMDDGILENYQVEVITSTRPIPKLLCLNQSPNTTDCSANPTFDKTIEMRELIGPVYVTRQKLHIDCDNRIGLVEDKHYKNKDGEIRNEQRLIGWNTTEIGYERMKSFSYEKSIIGGVVSREKSNFSRGEINGNNFRGSIFDWNSENRGGVYEDRLMHKDFISFTETAVDYVTDLGRTFSYESNTPGMIFTKPYYSQAMDTPYLTHESSVAKSPLGNKVVRTWVDTTTNDAVMVSIFDSGWSHPAAPISGANVSTKPRAAINDNGDIVMAWAQFDGSTTNAIQPKVKYAGSWQTPTVPNYGLYAPLQDVSVCMSGTQAAIVWTQEYSGYNRVLIAYSTDISTPANWKFPTGSSDAIIDSFPASGAKCVLEGNKLVVSYILNDTTNNEHRAWVTHATLDAANYTNVKNEFYTNRSQASSGPYLNTHEAFIEKSGTDSVVVSYVDRTNDTAFKSVFNLTAGTWNHYNTLALQTNAFFQKDTEVTKVKTADLGTNVAPMGTPAGYPVPAVNSILEGNSFGLRELQPWKIKGKMNTYSPFFEQ